MSQKIKTYHLPQTPLIPNSPHPLLHYPGALNSTTPPTAATAHALFARNGWQTQWIYRYGPTQRSHYHSTTHECMAVLSGSAVIRFGVADTTDDLGESTHGAGREAGGVELRAGAGDVFVIPAGVSHKTFDARPVGEFELLTPGDGHHVDAGDGGHVAGGDVEEALRRTELSGFTMIGAYPEGGVWDFAKGGEHVGEFEPVGGVPMPDSDPVMGRGMEGLLGIWKEQSVL
ncbi:MAG: cupin domain-containing protein [Janthinobacterium lividum]